MTARGLTVLALGALAAPAALAQSSAPGTGGRGAGVLLLQALLSLAVVLAVIYLAYFALRRLGGGRLVAGEEGPLRVLQARHLGGDRWLYLVRVGARHLVLGAGAGGLSTLADLGAGPPDGEGADDDSG